MTTTTSYGTWNNWGDRSAVTVEDTVTAYLGEFADDYNVGALIHAYRHEINAALPDGVQLCGDQFYGPYPSPADLDLSDAIASVDLGALAEQYDTTQET